MESFQGRAPPTGWNDLPATLSPNLRFGGGSKKRLNRNNLYQQYNNSSNSVYSYSSSSSQEYGLNSQQPPQMMNSQNSLVNGIATPPLMNSNTPPPPLMNSHTPPPPMMNSHTPPPPMMNGLNPTPPMMNSQTPPPPTMLNNQTPPPPTMMNSQTPPPPMMNYYNNTSSIPQPTYTQPPVNPMSTNSYVNNYQADTMINNYSGNTISPNSVNNVITIFNKYLENYNANCSLFQRKVFEDVQAKIHTMIEQLNGNMIDEPTVKTLEAIANALETRDSVSANSNISILMKNPSPDKKWILGVKGLVDYFFN